MDDQDTVHGGQVLLDLGGAFGEVFHRQFLDDRYLIRVHLEEDYPVLFELLLGLAQETPDEVQPISASIQGQDRLLLDFRLKRWDSVGWYLG